jgi:hypothetical protein
LNWYRKAQRIRQGKRGVKKREKIVKNISDDEGDDIPTSWAKKMVEVTPATKAIAIKWMRTARARLQKKAGRGAGAREFTSAEDTANAEQLTETFKSGRKSKQLRK